MRKPLSRGRGGETPGYALSDRTAPASSTPHLASAWTGGPHPAPASLHKDGTLTTASRPHVMIKAQTEIQSWEKQSRLFQQNAGPTRSQRNPSHQGTQWSQVNWTRWKVFLKVGPRTARLWTRCSEAAPGPVGAVLAPDPLVLVSYPWLGTAWDGWMPPSPWAYLSAFMLYTEPSVRLGG